MLQHYLDAVRNIDPRAYRAGTSHPGLLIGQANELVVEYAPFDHVETNAELAIVGLTPGRTQATNVLEVAAVAISEGVAANAALARAKHSASFSGPMRTNLLAMLDAVGLPGIHGISSIIAVHDSFRGTLEERQPAQG